MAQVASVFACVMSDLCFLHDSNVICIPLLFIVCGQLEHTDHLMDLITHLAHHIVPVGLGLTHSLTSWGNKVKCDGTKIDLQTLKENYGCI